MLLVLGLWVDLFTKALAFDKFDLFRRFGAGLISDVSEGAYVPEPARHLLPRIPIIIGLASRLV